MPWILISQDPNPVEFKDLEIGENFVHEAAHRLYRKVCDGNNSSVRATEELDGGHLYALRSVSAARSYTNNRSTCYRILVAWRP